MQGPLRRCLAFLSSRTSPPWSPTQYWRGWLRCLVPVVVASTPCERTKGKKDKKDSDEDVHYIHVCTSKEDNRGQEGSVYGKDGNQEGSVYGKDVTHVLKEGDEYTPVTITNVQVMLIALFAGGLGSAVAKTLIAPMDYTKRDYHAHGMSKPYSIRSALRTVRQAYRTKGISVFYKGATFQLLRAIPFGAFQFASHQEWKRYLEVTPLSPASLRIKAGALAGMTGLSIIYPIDLVLAKMFVLENEGIDTFGKSFKYVLKREGVCGLYRGFLPSMMGIIPYSGLSFYTYDSLKQQFLNPVHQNPSLCFMVFGAVAGFVGQTVSYPFETIRKYMQLATPLDTRFETFVGTILAIYRNQGVKGFYEGLSVHWIKGPIAAGAAFSTFDTILEVFKPPKKYQVK